VALILHNPDDFDVKIRGVVVVGFEFVQVASKFEFSVREGSETTWVV